MYIFTYIYIYIYIYIHVGVAFVDVDLELGEGDDYDDNDPFITKNEEKNEKNEIFEKSFDYKDEQNKCTNDVKIKIKIK
jgi:hypothetical protein